VASVVIAARGTSDHAAIYAQYLLGVRNGLPVGLATPSVVSLYGPSPTVRRSLVIGISQSGASPDIVGVIAAGAARARRRSRSPTTRRARSRLPADHVIDLAAGPELAVAATKTYTTSLSRSRDCPLALEVAQSGSPARRRP
jgi:glucosamine--fructose-6-phosphate aminotransferase (isomerizing)